MRLNKFLAACGVGSRRKCEQIILAGRVTINGREVTSLAENVDENNDRVTVDGRRVSLPSKFSYVLLHKPAGYITTRHDEMGRKTVMDLLPKDVRVFPVGRLDKNTTGALILTNDGDFAYQLTHPKFEVDKVYHVAVHRPVLEKQVRKLQSGIMLEEGLTSKCQVKVLDHHRKRLEIVLHEGRKRQVRRMVEALGFRVIRLARVRFSFLTLEGLKPGEWRNLTEQEIEKLRAIIG